MLNPLNVEYIPNEDLAVDIYRFLKVNKDLVWSYFHIWYIYIFF